MMRSLFSGVAGLRAHQTRMDVIGNNIANVNTVGFKSSRVTFQEIFSQTLKGAMAPSGTNRNALGGTNPMQIGLGVSTASIDTNHTPGSLQPTSNPTDLAIDGDGFFVVRAGSSYAYTRVGAFDLDGDGVLVNSQGQKVLGWAADSNGVLPPRTEHNLEALRIEVGSRTTAEATDKIAFAKNLNSQDPIGTVKTIPVTVYDSQGSTHAITIEFTKTNDNQWSWTASGTDVDAGGGTLVFDQAGLLDPSTSATSIELSPSGVDPISITVDFASVTQMAGPTDIDASSINGCTAGTLESFTFDASGTITGFYSNGKMRVIGQIALASFTNPRGLQRAGNNLFVETTNSGTFNLGEAGTEGRGTISGSALEMSNVDLAEEFTQMIVTQRGFQANSRVITVSDEMLQELVNMKR
jgi:flagellar hook protein FlgE